jgi:hypothetical protein
VLPIHLLETAGLISKKINEQSTASSILEVGRSMFERSTYLLFQLNEDSSAKLWAFPVI